jgi:hypothetical protein
MEAQVCFTKEGPILDSLSLRPLERRGDSTMPRRAPKRVLRPRRRAVPKSPKKIRLRNWKETGQRVGYVISQIPHGKQRYETVGDWIPGNPVKIHVSKMGDDRYFFLVALHEMIEFELCRMKGISDRKVVEFDINFEKERRAQLHSFEAEPGDDPRAPYRSEHGFATVIERMVARKLGVSWPAYTKAILSVSSRRAEPLEPLIRE